MSIRKNMLMAETLGDLEKVGHAGDDHYWCGCTEFTKREPVLHINLCPFHSGFDQGVRLGYERGLKHANPGVQLRTDDRGGKADLRSEVAWLLWCANEGYLLDSDREDLENHFLFPESRLHGNDLAERPGWLEMADTVIRQLDALYKKEEQ